MKKYSTCKIKRPKNFLLSGCENSGFSFIEILIALTVFSTFITAFYFGQGNNILDSNRMRDEKTLSKLCEYKLNQLLVTPPKVTASNTISKETGNFSDEGYADYTYEVEMKEMKLPDLSQLKINDGDKETNGDNNETNPLAKKMFDLVSKNLEKMIWQIKVTVKEKNSDAEYSLTSWSTNSEAKVNINL